MIKTLCNICGEVIIIKNEMPLSLNIDIVPAKETLTETIKIRVQSNHTARNYICSNCFQYRVSVEISKFHKKLRLDSAPKKIEEKNDD